MRRIAALALCIWIAVFASVALFALFWRAGYFRPHVAWGILSLAATLVPMAWLAISVLWRSVRGPCRLRAIGWLLVGATPLVWSGVFLLQLNLDRNSGLPYLKKAPTQIAAVWASWILDIEARWRYPRWTRGRHALLIDDGRTPSPEALAAKMDNHIQKMADLLGQPVPNAEFPWVRGPLFGYKNHGRAFGVWAICDQGDNPADLTGTDRHEIAHTLIHQLSGPDHDPPRLLLEGWAESQGRDRDDLLGYLAAMRKDGQTYSLQTLVEPNFRGETNGASYWEGGPVVVYLMERYGPKTFFRLYSGARCDTFQNDCLTILGDSWETVEKDFWPWLDAKAKPLAKPQLKQPDATPVVEVELAKSVNPADWQSLVEGYRKANNKPEPLPSDAAFVLTGDLVERKIEPPGPTKHTEHEFRAVFEGQRFWIFDNLAYGADCFLMGMPVRDDAGSSEREMRNEASNLLSLYRADASPLRFLPLSEKPWHGGIWYIERLVRPTEAGSGRWNIWFTERLAKAEPKRRYQIELDPAHRWWATRIVSETYAMDAEYQWLGDALMPVTLHTRYTDKEREATVECRGRLMSEAERRDLKHRVERSPRLGADPYRRLRCWFWPIVIACPLTGLTLLLVTRRRKPQETPATGA